MANEERTSGFREVFSRRLQMLRKMRGLSQAQLISKMKELADNDRAGLYETVSTTALEKYEKGLMMPQSSRLLCTISEALNVPIDDLMRPFAVTIDCRNFSFRKKSRLGKKKVEEIVLNIQNRIEKYVEIEEILNIKSEFDADLSDVIVDSEQNARKAAMRLRDEWGLGLGPIPQPIQVLEMHGVKVIEVNEDPTLFDGTSNKIEGIPVVVINTANKDDENPDIERRRFTLFHELGHQVLHFPADLSEKDEEHMCDTFANEMLIPEVTFKRLFGEKRQGILIGEVKNIQREFGISVRALMVKAKQLGVISENYHRHFCIRMNGDKALKAFIDHNEMQETKTTRYEQLIYRALAMEEISISKAASLMNIGVDELRKDLNFA